MTPQQREALCAEACREALRAWRRGKIGNYELIWHTWQARQRYGIGVDGRATDGEGLAVVDRPGEGVA